jgi:hypothetical protein
LTGDDFMPHVEREDDEGKKYTYREEIEQEFKKYS